MDGQKSAEIVIGNADDAAHAGLDQIAVRDPTPYCAWRNIEGFSDGADGVVFRKTIRAAMGTVGWPPAPGPISLRAGIMLSHMWNGPPVQELFSRFHFWDGAVICTAFGCGA